MAKRSKNQFFRMMIVMEHTGLYSFALKAFCISIKSVLPKSMHLLLNDQLGWSVVKMIKSMHEESPGMALKKRDKLGIELLSR